MEKKEVTTIELKDCPYQPVILPRFLVQKIYINKIITVEEYKALEEGKAVYIAKLAWCVMSKLLDATSKSI